MKLSTRTRYGVRLMIDLAMRFGEGPVYLREIASKEDISEKYLSQIIMPLKSAGLVHSHRGVKGGYELALEPSQITMLDVVQALEGKNEILACIGPQDGCQRATQCVARNLWIKVQSAMDNTLVAVTLSELVEQVKTSNKNHLNYSI